MPADRWGHATYSAPELKTMQEVTTLLVFAAFSVLVLGEAVEWNHLAGFACIALGRFSPSTSDDGATLGRLTLLPCR